MAKKSTKSNAGVNAGVQASTGFDFQKHCALYLLLESYNQLKGKTYFIYLEHYEDILFCYLENNKVALINAYQAKKASASWGCNQELFEIIQKITENGVRLVNDTIDKTTGYSHKLHFATNHFIKLSWKQRTPKKTVVRTVNDTNCLIEYSNLEAELQNLLSQELSGLTSDSLQIKELGNLSFRYIDLAKTSSSQREQLIGAFNTTFGKTVRDHAAAVDTLLKLFKKVETTFNQGGVVKLADNKKRIESGEVDSVVSVITNQQKAFELWREEKKNLAGKFNISVLDQSQFELDFENSFDLFKDLSQVEHRKVRTFVENNKALLKSHTNDVECLGALLEKFNLEQNSQLTESQMKATLYAAYIEIKSQ